jgi:hypothetical protein
MKYKECKYPTLENIAILHDKDVDYSVWFAGSKHDTEINNDFAFEFARGPYKNMWVLILADTIKIDGDKATFEYQIVRNLNNFPDEEFEKPEFVALVEKMVMETLTIAEQNMDAEAVV